MLYRLLYLSHKLQPVLLYTASAAPEDAHLGVPISLWDLTLSYDHHVCHLRNGETERWGEERSGGREQFVLVPVRRY